MHVQMEWVDTIRVHFVKRLMDPFVNVWMVRYGRMQLLVYRWFVTRAEPLIAVRVLTVVLAEGNNPCERLIVGMATHSFVLVEKEDKLYIFIMKRKNSMVIVANA